MLPASLLDSFQCSACYREYVMSHNYLYLTQLHVTPLTSPAGDCDSAARHCQLCDRATLTRIPAATTWQRCW